MKINRDEFLGVLKLAKVTTSTKQLIDDFSYLLFDKNYIYSSNGDMYTCHPFTCDFSCLVPADRLVDALSKMKAKEVSITCTDSVVKLKSGKDKVELNTKAVDAKALDAMCLTSPKKWKKLPEDFLDGVKQCLFSVSQDVARVDMSSISISDRKVCSSDDIRASVYVMSGRMMPFLLPLQAGHALVNFPNMTKYSLSSNGVYFTDDTVIFYTGRPDVPYPDVEPYFDFEGISFDLPKDFCSSVELVNLFSEEEFNFDKLISMTFEEDGIRLVSSDVVGSGETLLSLKLEGLKNKLCTKVNPVFLLEVVSKSNFPEKKLKISPDRILFDFGKFRHLMGVFEVTV